MNVATWNNEGPMPDEKLRELAATWGPTAYVTVDGKRISLAPYFEVRLVG